jgi:hypothetical protein
MTCLRYHTLSLALTAAVLAPWSVGMAHEAATEPGEDSELPDTLADGPEALPTIDPYGETIIEEDGPDADFAFTSDGYQSVDGHGAHAYWTTVDEAGIDYSQGINYSFVGFVKMAYYDLWAYIPQGVADLTEAAVYKVWHGLPEGGNTATKVYVDQAANAGSWAYLGSFLFRTDLDQWVRLGDNCEDGSNIGKKVVLDAIKIASLVECDCDVVGENEIQACDGDGEQYRTCDGCWWSEWSECIGGDDDDDDDAVGDDDDDDTGGTPPDDEEPSWESGCGCVQSGGGVGAASLASCLALMGLARRHRRRPRLQ